MDLFAPPAVTVDERADGSLHLTNPNALLPYARCVGEWLVHWAAEAPDRTFLAERDPHDVQAWRRIDYRTTLREVLNLATGLLDPERDFGLSEQRPLLILSDNSIEHALLSLACLHVGIPVVPVSPAYSLVSRDHAKLKDIVRLTTPGALYVPSTAMFAAALRAIAREHDAVIVTGRWKEAEGAPVARQAGAARVDGMETISFDQLRAKVDLVGIEARFRQIGPDTIAKILLTSGSTGAPKGVINTQRMLCASQQAKRQVWPFLADSPPVIVDWLPWNHTFGGNHNFNLVLRNGGTLYIDAGKAAPGLFDITLRNLREISPTLYFNVPRGFDLLVQAMANDPALRQAFFARLQLIFYAAAALPQNLWSALEKLSLEETGARLPMVAAWGSTETSPLATDCHFQAERSGVIGLPVPGTELKLTPHGGKLEIRVRGPNVTPGYWRASELTEAAFDDEGFYRIGDAVKLLDRSRPQAGLVFDGRIAEDFKLASGTWVNVGKLRVQALEALAPLATDVVVCGHDRDDVRLLVFVNALACRQLAGATADVPGLAQVLAHDAVRARAASALATLQTQATGSSTFASHLLLMTEPAGIDAGEITDKGYINQRAVLAHRDALVQALYQWPLDSRVIGIQ